MPQIQTPGVYVQEIASLPPGVAEVKSAIPAFIGYTQKVKYNETSILNTPVKIQSMLEFRTVFGEAARYSITNVKADTLTNDKTSVANLFYLYDSLQLYFLNGGGPCYIVSVGEYGSFSDSASAYDTAFANLDLYDEPTLYVMPDAVLLGDANIATVQQLSLKKCATLMDRFSIFDVKKNTDALKSLAAADTFRDKIGMAYLSYGAAYTPWLTTNLDKKITADSISGIFTILAALDSSILNFEVKGKKISVLISEYKSLNDNLADFQASLNTIIGSNTFRNLYQTDIANPFASNKILDKIKAIVPSGTVNAAFSGFYNANVKGYITGLNATYDAFTDGDIVADPNDTKVNKQKDYLNKIIQDGTLDRFTDLYSYMTQGLQSVTDSYEQVLINNVPYYASLLSLLKNKLTSLPPSGIMAGLYCQTDSARGVWKSAANISVSGVNGVTQLYTAADLDSLNIDATAGKSINVIRPITGKGVMVMAARTLDGNSSEWRYIAVRRLFIFVEENLKKATAWAVFEPNDKMLWTSIKAQISNYLFELWRQGALAGSKPEDAYQVNCGLNSTMTPQDILNGFLNVEIKLAAVRPAEFVVLKFSHQLQKS